MKGYKVICLRNYIFIISMFAVTNTTLNCAFRDKLIRRSCRIRQMDDQLRSDLSSNLSICSRRDVLELRRQLIDINNDSEQIIAILNGGHERLSEFSPAFIIFIRENFILSDDMVLSFNVANVENYLKLSVDFDQLRQIYLDSILFNMKFIRQFFEGILFVHLNIQSPDGLGSFYQLFLSLSNFLKADLFRNLLGFMSLQNNIIANSDGINIHYSFQEDVARILTCNTEVALELDEEEVVEYMQINFNFIVECFIREIENKHFDSINEFLLFVKQFFENQSQLSTEKIVEFLIQYVKNQGFAASIERFSAFIDFDLALLPEVYSNLALFSEEDFVYLFLDFVDIIKEVYPFVAKFYENLSQEKKERLVISLSELFIRFIEESVNYFEQNLDQLQALVRRFKEYIEKSIVPCNNIIEQFISFVQQNEDINQENKERLVEALNKLNDIFN